MYRLITKPHWAYVAWNHRISYGHEERFGDLLALPALADAAYPKAGVLSLGVGGHKLATFYKPMRLDHIL